MNKRIADLNRFYPEEMRLEGFYRQMESLDYALTSLSEPDVHSKVNPASITEGLNPISHLWDTPPRNIVLHYCHDEPAQ